MHTDRAPGKRSGFTLVEMLVVLAIILTLSVLTVLFMPRIQERQKVARGADFLQGWLLKAKQLALRNLIATGIRFQVVPSTSFVRDSQYVQKPDDYAPSGTYSADTLFKGPVNPMDPLQGFAFGPKVNLFGSSAIATGDETSAVQVGDYLQLRGEGLVHRITGFPDPRDPTRCLLQSAPQNPPGPGCTFRIIRQPRLLPGEEPLQLPQDVAIDLSKSLNVPTRQSSGPPFREILFSPSGRVVGQGTGNTPIVLWVRDVTQDANNPGDQTLIVIYPRTGSIAAHPVAQGGDPYQFIRDGRSSGF